ncbi:hypothetical protein DIPPA_11003 [Diplonema papillatum]|nr:hypothetical protein DIPPA_11003 [Diplonema papillatum]
MPAPEAANEGAAAAVDAGTPRVGRPRPKRHPVLLRHEVGKVPERYYSSAFFNNMVFGLRCKRDAFGAGDLMLSWKEHSPSVKHQAKLANFMALNKRAAAARCCTAKSVSSLRELLSQQPAKAQQPRPASGAPGRPLAVPDRVLNDPAIAFGAKSTKSDSVGDLIAHRFAVDWVRARLAQQEKAASRKRGHAKHSRPFVHPPRLPNTLTPLSGEPVVSPTVRAALLQSRRPLSAIL